MEQKLYTALDKYAALQGIPRQDGETLTQFKKRINAARYKPGSLTQEGAELHLTNKFGGAKLIGKWSPQDFYHIKKEGYFLKVYDASQVLLYELDLNVSYGDIIIGPLSTYISVTNYTTDTDFDARMTLAFDNLYSNKLVSKGNQVELLPHEMLTEVVLDSNYTEVLSINDIDDFHYYVDYSNGAIFCGNEINSTISYSYFGEINIVRTKLPITKLSMLTNNTDIAAKELAIMAHNSMPYQNIWR